MHVAKGRGWGQVCMRTQGRNNCTREAVRGEGTLREQFACGLLWVVAHTGKSAEMHVEVYSFSQWVQDGDQLLSTSLAGLVLLQPVLSSDSCVARSPCFLLPLPKLRISSSKDSLCEMAIAHGGCGMGSSGCRPCGRCKGERWAAQGWRKCQQLKDSLEGGRPPRRSSRTANQGKNALGLLGPLEFSYWKGYREDNGEMHDDFWTHYGLHLFFLSK